LILQMIVFEELQPEYVTLDEYAVAVDEHYRLYVNGRLYTSISANPAGLRELVLGLLIGDGLATAPREIVSIQMDVESRRIDVTLAREVGFEPYRVEDCGSAAAQGVYVRSSATFSLGQVVGLVGEFDRASLRVARLLAVHSTAVVQPDRGVGVLAHDPSRHTSALKALGLAVSRGFELGKSVMVTTGRASSDVVVRAARFQVPVLVSLKGPLMSGLRASEMLGVTLILSLRRQGGGKEFKAVTHSWRITS